MEACPKKVTWHLRTFESKHILNWMDNFVDSCLKREFGDFQRISASCCTFGCFCMEDKAQSIFYPARIFEGVAMCIVHSIFIDYSHEQDVKGLNE